MSLDYVSKGERIKASTVNSLIDAVQGGGNMSPDLLVTGTRSGPQIVAPLQLGSSTLSRESMFDVDNYMLSGWPMTKIKLGFALSNALDAVRIHDEDGVHNPISAFVIYQNSEGCPVAGGDLSTEMLTEDDFANNAIHGSGWVKTKLEGIYGGGAMPRLEVWKTDLAAYEVLTNADVSSIMPQLSAAIAESAGDYAKQLSMVDGWTLAKQDKLQSKQTSRIVMKNGIVDIWEGSGRDKLHFKWSTALSGEQNALVGFVGEGAVQIGGYTYFSEGGLVQGIDQERVSADWWVCTRVGLTDPVGIDFIAYDSLSALSAAQGDHSKYIFPLYKVNDLKVQVDYRPLPNAGCWELAEGAEGESQ